MTIENKSIHFYRVLFIALIPVVIFFYFLQWRTWSMYGDDLYIYKSHEGLRNFSEKIAIPVMFDKYRPVHGLNMHILIELFHKHTGGYYVFNVGIQAINAFLFALIVNLFLRSALLSLLAGLTVGLSRFAYFNITQLLNGGALEGFAMTFFLAAIYFLIRSVIQKSYPVKSQQRDVFLGVLFANAAMYTHERYIILLPFIVLLVLLLPAFRQLATKKKLNICALALGSIVMNVVLKKGVYGMPFFVGTAGTNIKFSFASGINFFTDAILSVVQINSGPDYLVGIRFTDLALFDKILVLVFILGIIAVLFNYVRNTSRAFVSRNKEFISRFWLVLFLVLLIGICLIPAVVSIRLEQRWLQASYAVFVLTLIIILSSFQFRHIANRNLLLSGFIFLLLWIDFNYLKKGADNIYITSSQKIATDFERAVNNGNIKPGARNIYLWEKQRDANSESTIKWILAEGYFFKFYQNQYKKVFYIDSSYLDTAFSDSVRQNFNKVTDQVVKSDNGIIDITNDYLQRSPKYFRRNQKIIAGDSSQYFPKQLLIDAADLDKFSIAGFYDKENSIRWTNGNATIGLYVNNVIKDTLTLVLNTYLPPASKSVEPAITLLDADGRVWQPVFSSRKGDKFSFKFFFPQLAAVQTINILSAKIAVSGSDQRTLSFPFISLEIRR